MMVRKLLLIDVTEVTTFMLNLCFTYTQQILNGLVAVLVVTCCIQADGIRLP